MAEDRIYIAIDLKSFFASVECRERDLDPLNTNLVVADATRTEKTICLAVTPSLKSYGIPGRARLFEVVQRVKEVNQERSQKLPKRMFEGSSCFSDELKEHPELSVAEPLHDLLPLALGDVSVDALGVHAPHLQKLGEPLGAALGVAEADHPVIVLMR